MAKHNFFNKTKSNRKQSKKIELSEQENSVLEEKTVSVKSSNPKSFLISGMKYIYILVIASLFSGIFTPLTLGVDIEFVLAGILTILFGLSGGILIFLGTNNQKYGNIMIITGSGIILASLFLIYQIIELSIYS